MKGGKVKFDSGTVSVFITQIVKCRSLKLLMIGFVNVKSRFRNWVRGLLKDVETEGAING